MDKYYRVLVVDDEEEIRDGLVNYLPWKEWGYDVVGAASNGEEGVELINKVRPDVVLTDIVMPQMDGLEMIHYIDTNEIKVEVVIVSGYSDINYYKDALKYHVVDYLLKPTSTREFEAVFAKLKIELDRRREEKKKMELLKDQLNNSIEIMKVQFLSDWCSGHLMNESHIRQKLAFYGMEDYQDQLRVMSIDYKENGMKSMSREEKYQLKSKLIKAMNASEGKTQVGFFFLSKRNEMLGLCSDCDYVHFAKRFEKAIIRYKISAEDRVTLFMGVSECFSDITKVKDHLMQSIVALRQMQFFKARHIIYYSDIVSQNTPSMLFNKIDKDKVIEWVFFGKGDIAEILKDFFVHCYNRYVHDYKYIDHECNELYNRVIRQAKSMKMSIEDIDFFAEIEKLNDIEKKERFLIDLLMKVKYKAENKRTDSGSYMIHQIDNLINSHFCDEEMSLEYLAEAVNKTPGYVSSFYKSETGNNVLNRVIELRINKAKELLMTTSMKTYEVSSFIGYRDPSYFTKLFKKIVEISPTEYRKRSIE